MVGIDLPAEHPEAPDLVLDNYGGLDVGTAVDRILALCEKQNGGGVVQAVPAVAFRTKAESLEAVAPHLRLGRVLPQVRFSVGDWLSDPAGVLAALASEPWGSGPVIVRSSARSEDGPVKSQAGTPRLRCEGGKHPCGVRKPIANRKTNLRRRAPRAAQVRRQQLPEIPPLS